MITAMSPLPALAAAIVALWACTAPPALGQAVPGSSGARQWQVLEQRPGQPDHAFLARPEVRPVVIRLARRYAARIAPDGAFRANTGDELAIQRQRRAFDVVAGGVMLGGRDGARLVDRGIEAIRWGLDRRGTDDFFPGQGGRNAASMLPRAFFLEAAFRSLLLLRDEPSLSRAADLPGLQAALHEAATALGASPALRLAEEAGVNSNGLFVAAAALQGAAELSGDERLAGRARQVVGTALARQAPDGTFPERGGYDSNYQSVSLHFLARYIAMLPESAWREEVAAAARRGAARLLSSADPLTGRIDDRGNTRTIDCPPLDRVDPDAGEGFALRLRYIAHILGDPSIAAPSERVAAARQRFQHIERCERETIAR